MKGHIGVDAVATTSDTVADVTMAGALVRDDDKWVHCEADCIGMEKYLDEDKRDLDTRCYAVARRSAIKKMEDSRKNE